MVLKINKGDADDYADWQRRNAGKAADRLAAMGLDPTTALSTELGFLVGLIPTFGDRALEFDLYQARFLSAAGRLRSLLKARQVGFSFAIAAESLARCHLKDSHLAVCVSYNLDDAKEKVQRVKELHDELPLRFQKRIVVDAKTEVGFASSARKRLISRVISYPSKPPRGKSGDVYLDELAHCLNDDAIYAGATSLITRSGGQLTIGSTPLGQKGKFHELHTDRRQYPDYWRQQVPWWLCRQFCKDIPTAAALAPSLPTEVRVERWGTPELLLQFGALLLDDFQQEYELAFQDERVAFFPHDLISPCEKEREEIPVYASIEALLRAGPAHPLYLGFDVGRSKHPSELYLMEKVGPTFITRYAEQFINVPYPTQRARLMTILKQLGSRWKKFRIDATGGGKNLAEDLQKVFGKRIEAIQFTMQVKSDLAYGFKILMEERNVVLPKDRTLRAQIHSIKQKITESGNVIFDAEKNKKHHADKMWALALACYTPGRRKATHMDIGVRVLGEHKTPAQTRGGLVIPGQSTRGVVTERGVIEQLFTVPDEATAVLRFKPDDHPVEEVEKYARALAVSIRLWKRSNREDLVRQLMADYQRCRRNVIARRAGRLVPAGREPEDGGEG